MELRYFIVRRLLLLIPTLVGMTVLAFIFFRAFPDSILTADFVSPHATGSRDLLVAQAKIALGLNYPVPVQYFYFLLNLFIGNWGYTNVPLPAPVYNIISLMWPNTAQLLIFTLMFSAIIGIPLGTYMGSKRGSAADSSGRIFTLVGYAMPQFFFGLILLLVFGKGLLDWPGAVFPLYGSFTVPIPPPSWLYNANLGYIVSSPTHMVLFDALIHGSYRIAYSAMMHMVLPVATLTYAILAVIVRTMRSGIIDADSQDFVRTAMAKGVPRRTIVKKHIRRNAMLPVITVMGLLMGYLITGIIVVETLFSYKGLGWFIVQSTLHLQVFGIIYSAILLGIFIVISTIIVDILLAYVDPRIRY